MGLFRSSHLVALALLSGVAVPAVAQPVLLVSIDGLRPGDVTEAEKRGIAVPNLRRLLAEGSHASGVRGVLPTNTLPSHVTLVTGTSPARHGVYNNIIFRPEGGVAHDGSASAIKVPTLWDAAHAKGIGTASVNWPVSTGSPSIDRNILDIGRSDGEEKDLRTAEQILKDARPGFFTVHFGALDGAQHRFGPGSPEAKAALEAIDTYIGQLAATARAAEPDVVIAVVSDHGFTPVRTEINLIRAFIDAGLVRPDGKGGIASWDAAPFAAGGSAAIILARPKDAALKARVAALLDKLKADPTTGIEEVYGADELARRGGFPDASFGISYRLDTTEPSAPRPLNQPLVSPAQQKGTHGHAATHPELYSTFIIAGPGVAKGRDIGVIDIRTIAPTLAAILGVSLPDAEQPALSIQTR